MSAFGKVDGKRLWLYPGDEDPVLLAKFRAAVWQSVVAVHVRSHKNAQINPRTNRGMPLEEFAKKDERSGSLKNWGAKFNGRQHLSSWDMVTIMRVLPGALPFEETVQMILQVAEKQVAPPKDWVWGDR